MNEVKKDDTEEISEGESKEFFVGPSQEPWWKFKLAGICWKLTRGSNSNIPKYIPGASKVAKWSFKVRVMSRDFEVKED